MQPALFTLKHEQAAAVALTFGDRCKHRDDLATGGKTSATSTTIFAIPSATH